MSTATIHIRLMKTLRLWLDEKRADGDFQTVTDPETGWEISIRKTPRPAK